MKMNPRHLYGLALVLAMIVAVLRLIAREWFGAATSVVFAVVMFLAFRGFPERSQSDRMVYYTVLGFLIVMLSVQIFFSLARNT